MSTNLRMATLGSVVTLMADEIRDEGGDALEPQHIQAIAQRAAAAMFGPQATPTTQQLDVAQILEAATRLYEEEP